MNPKQLLAHFDRISEAPDAIPRLRRFILDLAVRGKLVEQDPKDEPASELLRTLHRTRKYPRKFVKLSPEDLESPLPLIPTAWTWTVIDQLSADDPNAITDGPFGANLKTAHYVPSPGFRVIRLQNIGPGVFRDEHRSYIDKTRFERLSKHHVLPGDLLVAGLVDPRVRCCRVPDGIGPALVKADCYRFAVHPRLSSRFAQHYLNSGLAQEFAAVHHHGMTLTRIGLGNFRSIPIPLPPLAEQDRIVAKVDELMALCDRLEAAQAERESRRDRLVVASLHRLNNAADPDAFREHARFHLRHLPRLTTRPEQIREIRQTILNLAVRGKLVRQDPDDEPATELLRRIQAEMNRMVRDGQIRLISNRSPVNDSDVPFQLPGGWQWGRVQDLFTSVTDGDHLPPPKTSAGIPFLVIGNVRNQSIDFSGCRHVGHDYYDALDAIRRPTTGDVLYTLVGSYGIPIIVRDNRRFCVQRHIGILRPSVHANVAFLALAMESQSFFDQASACATGIAQKTVPLGGLRRMLLPIPPVAEQLRIVAKVEELIALCDRVEEELAETRITKRRLLGALLHEALG